MTREDHTERAAELRIMTTIGQLWRGTESPYTIREVSTQQPNADNYDHRQENGQK